MTIITNAKITGYQKLQQITINNEGKIADISEQKVGIKGDLNAAGDWISLGGIDLQINGGLGLAFPDLELRDLPKLQEIGEYLWSQGVDAYLPTIVTTSVEKIRRSLSVIQEFLTKTQTKNEAQILGVHLEGPFLNYEKRGAHPEEYLLPLTIENVKKILTGYENLVKIITLAPELDEVGDSILYLSSLGITVSLGHSLATAEQAEKAFKLGAKMVTHAFNAMPNLHHREPGLLGEAIVNSNVYCGLIADGIHVNKTMIKILLNASNYDQGIFLVSDALAPIGLADGIYPWDSREIEVKNGTARLKNGTLSGTTLPLLIGVQNLVNWKLCDPEIAINLATESPRKAIGLTGISVGQPANLLRWTYHDGNLTWQRLL
jgi:N-acetylglucosamine-6-phosphate deacetylase